MKYFKDVNGNVFAYETHEERNKFGTTDLVAMTKVQIDKHLTPVTPIHLSPKVVTMRQARLALHKAALLQSVEHAIAAMPEPSRTAAAIEWDYASEIHRDSAFVDILSGEIGLDSEALDNLFISASVL